MATGRLGATNLTAGSETSVYTVPASTVASLSFTIVNRNNVDAKVRIALAATSTATSAEFIEYDAAIPASGVLERSGIILDAGKHLTVKVTTGDNVNVVVYGYEIPA